MAAALHLGRTDNVRLSRSPGRRPVRLAGRPAAAPTAARPRPATARAGNRRFWLLSACAPIQKCRRKPIYIGKRAGRFTGLGGPGPPAAASSARKPSSTASASACAGVRRGARVSPRARKNKRIAPLKHVTKQPFTTVNQRLRTGGVVGVAVEEVGRARAVGGGGGLAGTESKRESYGKSLLSRISNSEMKCSHRVDGRGVRGTHAVVVEGDLHAEESISVSHTTLHAIFHITREEDSQTEETCRT